MTAKEFLSQAHVLERGIRTKQKRLANLKELATKTTITISTMPRPETPDPQRKEDIMVDIADAEKEIEADRNALAEKRRDIIRVIAKLQDPTQMEVLTKLYIDYKPWKTVLQEVECCESHSYRAHRSALAEVEKLI